MNISKNLYKKCSSITSLSTFTKKVIFIKRTVEMLIIKIFLLECQKCHTTWDVS